MHEYSIVQSLLEAVDREVHRNGASRVCRLELRLGELAGVDADLLRKAYEVCRTGTPCAEADLTIRPEAARWSCPDCRTELPRGAALRCLVCDTPATLTGGDAMILERLELEVADH